MSDPWVQPSLFPEMKPIGSTANGVGPFSTCGRVELELGTDESGILCWRLTLRSTDGMPIKRYVQPYELHSPASLVSTGATYVGQLILAAKGPEEWSCAKP